MYSSEFEAKALKLLRMQWVLHSCRQKVEGRLCEGDTKMA